MEAREWVEALVLTALRRYPRAAHAPAAEDDAENAAAAAACVTKATAAAATAKAADADGGGDGGDDDENDPAARKARKDLATALPPYAARLMRVIHEHVIPNACKSNTDSFRGELSMDEVQNVFKQYKPQLMRIFRFYAREHEPLPGQANREPSLDGPAFLRMLKDSKTITRKGDLRHDFPELAARKVFNDTQAEESGEGSVDAGGGADQMIYMEYLEALGAIACYKYPNPYIPLHIKLEQFFTDSFYGLFPNLVGKALPKPRKSAKKGAKAVGAAARAKKKK